MLKRTIPKIIAAIPITFFVLNFSFKNRAPNTATYTYPLASNIGPIDSGTNLYASTVNSDEPKNKAYASITGIFKYSCNLLAYVRLALFFKITCDTEEMNTENKNSPIYRISMFICCHHHIYSKNNNQCPNYIKYRNLFFKN